MKATSVSVWTLLLVIFIKLLIAKAQLERIREGRCPPIKKRDDCPTFVWDDCTCDLDCPGNSKCCLDGCRHVCLEPDTITPSVRNKADVVFVMDSSGSIGKVDYNREKQFVKDLINVFSISPNATRVSTIIYSDFPKLVFDFNSYSDKRSINTAIDNLEYLGNRTRIDKALALGLTVFSKSRPSVPRIAFVLTDGRQTQDYDAKPLDIAVKPLHDLGVYVYVIGIGSHIKKDELYLLARRRQDVFFVDSFEKLLQQTYRIVNQIDTYDLIPPLEITADMLFLVDSSSAVSKSYYQEELDFLKKVVELFRISPRYVRAGIIPYGNRAELSIPLGRHETNEAINRSIDSLPYIGGTKRIEQALILANQTFSSARPLVPKILLILTHGGRLTEPGTDLRTLVQALRDQGTTLFVIAIGESIDYLSLGQIVPRNNMITDESHETLVPYLSSAASYIRVNSDFSTPLHKYAAIVFLIDSSENVETDDFKRQKEFVVSLTKAFKIPENGARASVITYGGSARPTVQLKDSADFERFVVSMIKTSQMRGPRRMDKALRLAVRMLKDHVKPGPRAVVLFTSGPQSINESADLDGATKQLEKLGAHIYVIAIGPEVSYREIRNLVNTSDDLIQIPSFIKLQSEIHAVGRHISRTQGARPLFIADIVFLMDSSSGVGVENYRRQKNFIKVIAKALNLGEQATRACLVVYSDTARLVTRFDSHKTLRQFESAVDRAPYLRRTRRVDKALEYAASLLRRARRGVPKVTVLITSGRRASANPLDVASKPLKTIGAKSFIVAIGNALDTRELRLVVDKDSDIFRVPYFIFLPRIEGSFPKHIISSFVSGITTPTPTPTPEVTSTRTLEVSTTTAPTTTSVKPLDIIADVVFVIDSSSNVPFGEYKKEKDFIKVLARYLNISPGNSQGALVAYGNRAAEVIGFDIERPLSVFETAVDNSPYINGKRRIDRSLNKTAQVMANARPSATKIVVLLTAGKQSSEVGSQTPGQAAAPLLKDGVYTYVVAIGREPDISELRPMVQDLSHIFRMASYDDLVPRSTTIVQMIIDTSKPTPSPTPADPHVIKTFKADIVFLVDTSSLVGVLDFRSQKQFVKSMAKSLNVAPENSRAAIVTYGSTSSQPDSSAMHVSLSSFDRAVDGSQYIGGPRRMHYAIDIADALLRTARANVSKVVFLLTGGKQSFLQDVPLLKQSFKTLSTSGTDVFVITIGSDHEKRELLPGVRRQEDIFAVTSFETLLQHAWNTSKAIAERVDPVVPRDFQADVLFIMDSSSGVSREDYKKEKDFVESLANYLRVSPSETRAALLTYGYTAIRVAAYDSYDTLSLFRNAVKGAPYIGGSRRIDKALDYASQIVPYSRKLLPKIVVLLTAGRQELGYPLDVEAKRLRDQDVKTYIVAIGDKPNLNELRPIVRDEESVFKVSSFDDLQRKMLPIAQELGKQPDPELPANFLGADVLFIVDSSSDVSPYNYEKEKELVKALSKTLNSPGVNSRTAFITYGNRPQVIYQLDNNMSSIGLQRAIDSAQPVGGGRRTDRALEEGVQLLRNSKRSVPKIVLLITAGQQVEEEGVQPLSSFGRALQETGATSFVLAIGRNVSIQELRPVVKDAQDLFKVKTFQGLKPIMGRLAYYVVQRTAGITVPETDVVFLMDSSSEVSQSNYRDEKEAVKSMARSLKVPSGRSKASVITYGIISSRVVKFNSYRTFSALESAIDRAPTIGGVRRIDRALEDAGRLLSEARASVRRSVILLTSGRADPSSRDLYEAAKSIFEEKAELFIIAIGRRPYEPELTAVVKKPEHVFNVSSFSNLEKESEKVTRSVVQIPRPEYYGYFSADIIFLVDSSVSVDQNVFTREKAFVKFMMRSLDLTAGKSRVAVISYGSTPVDVARFSSSGDVETIASEVDKMQFVSGRRNISKALEHAASLLNKARVSVSKVVVLLTTGSDLSLVVPSKALRDYGTDRYVIAIEVGADEEDLTPIVDNPRDIFSITTPQELTWRSGYVIDELVKRTIIKDTAKPLDFDADVLFLVDSSYDVSREKYEKEKDFVKSLAYILNLSPGKTRVAVIIYSNSARPVIGFTDYTSPSSFERRVDSLPFLGERRRFDVCLIQAGSVLKTARASASKVVVLLTAGNTQVDGAQPLNQAMASLRPSDANMFVVAIGPQVDKTEFRAVVLQPDDIFHVTAFDLLRRQSQAIAQDIKNKTESERPTKSTTPSTPTPTPTPTKSTTPSTPTPTPTKVADVTTDIVFLIDSSNDLSQENFKKQKDFVASLAKRLNFGSGEIRVAVLLYSDYVRPAIRFDVAKNPEFLKLVLDGLPFLSARGGRRFDRALVGAAQTLGGSTDNVRKIVILLAAGQQTQEFAVDDAVNRLKADKAEMYVVAIEPRANREELRPIVERDEDVISVNTFDGLMTQLVKIAEHISKGVENTTDFNGDVVFLVDSSVTISRDNFKKETNFVKTIARLLNVKPQMSRAAVISYGANSTLVTRFTSYSSVDEFKARVDSAPYEGGDRRMDRAIWNAGRVLGEARRSLPKVVILLTSGPDTQSIDTETLFKAAEALRGFNAKVYVVAIGSGPDVNELLTLVGKREDLFQVPSFDDLHKQGTSMAWRIADSGPTADSQQVNVIFLIDASLDVTGSDFVKEKDFVKSVARSLELPLNETKIAAIPYGASVKSGILNTYQTLSEFDRDVDSLQRLTGSRRMDEALKATRNILRREKAAERNIVILLTAGRQAVGYRGVLLTNSGKGAMEAGAEIFVVAIGKAHSVDELKSIVLSSQDIYQIGSFNYLQREARTIGKDIRNAGVIGRFGVTADIVIMVDSSAAVGGKNYDKEKEFVKSLARLVNITSGKSRIAVVVYSGSTILAVRFDGYKSLDEFDKALDEIPLLGGPYRRMDLALRSAGQVLSSAGKDVPKIAVLLTAGSQVPGGISLNSATKQLRSLNASTLVVALGKQYSKPELSAVVTAPKDLFELASFDSLALHARTIGQAIEDITGPKPEDLKADVVFLVDSSSSVTSIGFNLEKKFVKAMARSLNVSPDKSRASVIVYGSSHDVVMSLERFTSLDTFKSFVDNATYIDGPRRMDLALEAAAAVMNRARENSPKVVILLTAGEQSPTNKQDPLSNVVKPLRDLRVQTFVVSIGSDPDKQELFSVVEDPRDIFEVPSFEALLPETRQITKSIAGRSQQQPMDIDADVVFLVDSSSFVSQKNFVKEKEFVKSLVKFLNVSPEYSRASVVLFGSSPNKEIRFGDYRTLSEFNLRLDQTRLLGGSRRMDLALGEAADILIDGRRGVPHIVVLVTTGEQTSSNDSLPLDDAMKPLDKLGVHTFVVAIEHDPDTSANVLPVPSFNDLPSRVYDIAKRIKSESEPKPANITVDVVFLVDSSSSVGRDGFVQQKSFVKSLAKYLNVSPGKSRAAFVAYSTTARTLLKFTDYQTETEFNQKLDKEPWSGGLRRIDLALEAADTLLAQPRGNTQKVVVLVTGGRHISVVGDTPLGIAAQPLKDIGAKTIVVTVGTEVNYRDFLPVVDSSDDLFAVPLFDDLRFEVQPIVKYTVKSFDSPIFNITSEVIFILDASTTVGRDNFDKQKEFVKLLTRSLNVAPEKSRAALMTYSTNPFTVIPLGNYSTVQDFKRTLNAISFYGGERRMDRALEEAVDLFKRARPGVQRKVILLSAGKQTPSEDEKPLDEVKKMLLGVGALPFIVAIGDDHDFSTLTTAVEDPNDVIKVPSFQDLLSHVPSTASRAASRTTTPPLEDEYILFLLDSSSAVKPEQFRKEKDFIKTLAKLLNVGNADKTKAVVINYGSLPSASVKFDGFSTLREFESGVDSLTPAQGRRRIDRALDEAAGIFKQTDPSSSKILVLLTTGRQAPESDVTPFDVAIQPIKDMGTNTYVIAIGNEPSTRELRPLVSKAEDLFRVLFDTMESEASRVVNHIRKENPRPHPKNDFVFLMDSSSDVTRTDFLQEILFVKSLARELSVTPSEFQAAVISFGDRSFTVVRFGSYSSLPEFYLAVNSSIYQGGQRRMDRALEAASSMLSSRKPESRKTVILLTGGRNSPEAGSNSLRQSVQTLRGMGAKVIIMAFGNRYDVQELLPIVLQQQDIHLVPGANDLVPYVSLIATYITSGPSAPLKQPELEAEVLFVIDSSYEIDQGDYKRQKEFIKSLLRGLDMSTESSRAALITYGDHSSIASRFIGLQSLDDFDKSVDNASYIGGDRRIDNALKMVARLLNEAEAASSKLVIFLTGGKQSSSGGSLNDPVEPLRQSGAKTFVIAIGKQPDVQQLRPLVASPNDVLTVITFKDLNSQTSRIASHVREKAVTLEPGDIVDVVFLVDSSNGVNLINFYKEKIFVKLLAKRLNVSPKKSHAAVITYGSRARLDIDFNGYDDLPAFERLVDRIAYIGGARRIDKAFEAAAGALKGSRPSVSKMVVLLTSGRQPQDAPSLETSAATLHSLGAVVYVVSVANDLDPKYFGVLVEDSRHVSRVPSFDVLNNALSQVTSGIEEGLTTRKRLNADVVFLMDASTADSSSYFQSQKDLIKSITRSLGTSAVKLRASLLVYSSSTNVLADLRSYTTLERFEDVVDRATYVRGIRRIDKALAAAAQQLGQSRPSAAKIVVLITTGRQAQVLGMTPLDRASQPLRDSNANILVIGIGKQPDIRELNLISKNPQNVKIIPSPDEVIISVHLLSRKLRQDAIKEKQPALIPRADLIFLLDSSNDVTSAVFKQQKDFIKSIVGHFQIAPNKTRAAVIRYSNSASAVINFNTHDNLPDLLTGIDNIRFLVGRRRLDAALKEANKMRERARLGVRTYVIVLTAGRQAVTQPLDKAAQPLLDSTAHAIAVGIGSQPDDRELRSMVDHDRDVFRLLPAELQLQAPLLVVYLASQGGTPLPRNFKADVLFLVDSSQTISKEKFLRELDFVKAFARTLDISPDKSRVSVVSFGGDPAPPSIAFEDYATIESLVRGIDVVPYMGGQKRLDKALLSAARVLDKSRPDVNKFLVVVTDGKQPLGREPLDEATRPLHELGVKVNVVGAGEKVDAVELGKITSKPDDLFYSKSFEVLVRLVPVVFEQIVSVGTKPQVRHGLFLVDSSGYRSTSQFAFQIDFIKSIAKRLYVSPTGTRAGVILYDSEPQLSITLDDYNTIPEFYALLDGLSLQGGGRELHKALKLAGDTLQKSPEAIPKFVVVFVEGQQYLSDGVATLRDAVRPLQALGVAIFVVGIGNRLNRQELETLVQNSENIVTASGFAELLRQVVSLSQLIDTIKPSCKETLDVGFVIDASGSMGLDNFSREKNFVKLVSRRIADSSPETRLGLISFSDTPKLFVDFGDFKRITIDQFQETADRLPFQGGRSRIDLALQAASQDFFTDRRSGVPRVLVLVSDGRQSEDPGHTPLSRAIKPLQGQRVKVLAVAFGGKVSTKNLEIITGSSDNILPEKEFDDIDRLQRELVSKTCKI